MSLAVMVPAEMSTLVNQSYSSSRTLRSTIVCLESPDAFGSDVVGLAEKTYLLAPYSPSMVTVRVLSVLIAVHTEVSLKIADGVSAFLPSLPRAIRNFGLRSTLVKRCATPPKSCSALVRAAGIVGPNAGPTSRQAVPASISSARATSLETLLYEWSGGMALGIAG